MARMAAAALLSAALLGAACGPAGIAAHPSTSALPPGSSVRQKLAFGGLERTYLVYVPPTIDHSRPAPVVLLFHGSGGSAAHMESTTGFDLEADRYGFIAVYPQGVAKNWDAGACCGPPAKQKIDDVGFVGALLVKLEGGYSIDRHRVYATGISNGATLSYRLACEMSGSFAAIGPVAGSLQIPTSACRPDHAVSIIHLHGTADTTVPFGGGLSPGGLNHPPVPPVLDLWRRVDGCTGPPTHTVTGLVNSDVSRKCTGGSEIDLYLVTGMDHVWPGSNVPKVQSKEADRVLNASDLVAAFFVAHPQAGLAAPTGR